MPWFLNKWLWLSLAIVGIAGALYWKGGEWSRTLLKEAQEQLQATEQSNQISVNTQQRVDNDGYSTRKASEQRVERVEKRIATDPAGADQLDADILRESREAHNRAIRAACRMRRAVACDGAQPAP